MKIEEINLIRERLKNAPEVDQRSKEINKLDAVRMMSSEISLMFNKGYTLEQIAELMSEEGFKIAESTLKSYLNKTKRTKPRKKFGTKSGTKKLTETIKNKTIPQETKARTASFVPNTDSDEI